jgi:hypothetical protein
MGRYISNAQPQTTPDTEWKAAGFLNLSLPKKNADGSVSYVKLGTGIPLRLSKANEKKLYDMCQKDPEAAAKVILQHLRIEFRSAEPVAADFAFELPTT